MAAAPVITLAPLVISEATPIELPPYRSIVDAVLMAASPCNADPPPLVLESESPLSFLTCLVGKRVDNNNKEKRGAVVVADISQTSSSEKRDFISIGLPSLLPPTSSTTNEKKRKTFAEILCSRFSAFQAVTTPEPCRKRSKTGAPSSSD